MFGRGGDDWVLGYGGNDTLHGETGDDILEGGTGNDIIWGGDDRDLLLGGQDNDDMHGGEHDDVLFGEDGNDTLVGDAGADTMYGGLGNDVYVVTDRGDQVLDVADAAGGLDKVYTTLNWYDLRPWDKGGSGIEELQFVGTGNFVGRGNDLDNALVGGAGDDSLHGNNGNDILVGGEGRDTLRGGDGHDWINGEGGADYMYGGTGNDTYVVNHAGDRVFEDAVGYFSGGGLSSDGVVRFIGQYVDAGIDTVETALSSYTLPDYVENLNYTGASWFLGTGNGSDNVITSRRGNDILQGLGGDDTLNGGGGDDTLYGFLDDDTLNGGNGNDFLSGDDGNDVLRGNSGDDRLVGGAGNDTFYIGSRFYYGRDTIVEHPNWGIDEVIYDARTGFGEFGYTLAPNVENLTFTGSFGIRGWGNGLDNVLIGNEGDNTLRGLEGNDTLDGGAGFDTLIGGAGDDTYRVTSTIFQKPDTVVEDAGGGTDTVIYTPLSSLASITPSYTLADNLENLTIGGALDADGTGNGVANILVGNAASNALEGLGGADTLDGGLGFDSLDGGEGDDTLLGTYEYSVYGVDYMDGGAGTDTADFSRHGHAVWIDLEYPGREVWTRDTADVEAGAWRQVADLVSIENLAGTAGNDQMWGNGEANVIHGHAGGDLIDGRGGNDILSGGFALEADSRGDDGDDRVFGGLGDDLIIASYGSDTIDGGDDSDTLSFAWVGADLNVDLGLGTTTFREGGGYVTEFASGGWSALVTTTWSGIENLIGGLGNDTLAGDSGANRLEGGDGDDTINGGAGNDTLGGGLGADVFTFATAWGGDIVSDFADGADLIDLRQVAGLSSFDQLGIANLATGAEISFGGNSILLWDVDATALSAADFLITELPAGQIIEGTDGDDVLVGGLGADTISGRGGSDVIFNADSSDTVDGGDGYDYVYAGAHTAAAGFTFTVAGTNVEYVDGGDGNDVIDASGVSVGFTQSFGDAGDDVLIGGAGIDWLVGGIGSDTGVFAGNRADYTLREDVDNGWTGWTMVTHNATGVQDWILSVEALQFADMTIAAPSSWQEVKGTDGIDIIEGGDAREEIYGLAGNDRLDGGAGNDLIFGGIGADELTGGLGSDVLYIDNDDTLVQGGDGYDYVYADDSQGPIGLQFDVAGTGIELVFGGLGNDVIDGSGVSAVDEYGFGVSMIGNAGNDVLIGSVFGDYVEGGDGNDTMVFAGTQAEYAISTQGGGTQVTHTATGAIDWIYTVETLQFIDSMMTL